MVSRKNGPRVRMSWLSATAVAEVRNVAQGEGRQWTGTCAWRVQCWLAVVGLLSRCGLTVALLTRTQPAEAGAGPHGVLGCGQERTDSIVAIMIPGMGSSSVMAEDGDDGGDSRASSAQHAEMGSMGSAAPGATGMSGTLELLGRLGRLADVAGPDRDVTSGLEHRARAEVEVPVTEVLRLRGLLGRRGPAGRNTF